MNNQLQIFNNDEFGQVRTIEENSRILFCGSDVAKSLGYKNTNDAIVRHCKGVVKHDTLTTGGIQSLSFITEGDLYRLITHSKLRSAEKFESWVFDEVLPSIRKTGSYGTANDALIQFISQLPKEEIKKIINQLTTKALPIKPVREVLYDFLSTSISILRQTFEGYVEVDADLLYEFFERNGHDKFTAIDELKKENLVQINWCGKCVLTNLYNGQLKSVIVIEMKPSVKFYECE